MTTIVRIGQRNSKWIGYDVELSDGRCISVKLDNIGQCCEIFGAYLEVNGKFICDTSESMFIGAEVLTIAVSDKEMTEYRDKDNNEAIIYVTMTTSRGTLVIYLYNKHNGYYQHDYVIQIGPKYMSGKL